MSAADNVEAIRTGVEAFNRRDFDTALSLLHDDIRWERFLSRAEAESSAVRGKEELRRVWESQVEAVDLRAEIEEIIPVGELKVVVPVQMVARGSASEITLRTPVTWLYTFDDDGLAVEIRVYEKRDDALRDAKAT